MQRLLALGLSSRLSLRLSGLTCCRLGSLRSLWLGGLLSLGLGGLLDLGVLFSGGIVGSLGSGYGGSNLVDGCKGCLVDSTRSLQTVGLLESLDDLLRATAIVTIRFVARETTV